MRSFYTDAENHATAYLDNWSALSDGPIGWIITGIDVHWKNRHKGVGTRLLKRVLADADKEGEVLWLNVDPDGSRDSLSFDQLRAWYMKHGFKDVTLDVMKRIAQARDPEWEGRYFPFDPEELHSPTGVMRRDPIRLEDKTMIMKHGFIETTTDKLYFLVEITPDQEDCKEDPDLPPKVWNGIPYPNEEAYRAQVVKDVIEDIGELGVFWETKIMQIGPKEVPPALLDELSTSELEPDHLTTE